MSAGLILNRLCGRCHHRFGEHRSHDDACPAPPENWRLDAPATFTKWTPDRPIVRDEENETP